jgi:hypothetical protein
VQAAPLPVEDVEQALADVYARPELAAAAESALTVWLRDTWQRIADWVSSLFGGIRIGGDGVPILGVIAVAVFVTLAVVFALRLVRMRDTWWPERGMAPAVVPAGAASRSAADWHAHARRLAEAGRWRDATLALYQALLLGLEARGVVRYDPSKTPGDYRRELRGQDATRRHFDTFVATWEPAAFGHRPADAAVFATLDALAGEVAAHG